MEGGAWNLGIGRIRKLLLLRLFEVVQHAVYAGPQEITVHGRLVVVVISPELFDRLSGNQPSLVDFMRQSPLYGSDDIEFERDRSLPHEGDF